MSPRGAAQAQLDLGELEGHDGELYPTARQLKTEACPKCGEPVVRGLDISNGQEVLADARPEILLWCGERTDGAPLLARPSNGLIRHVCSSAPQGPDPNVTGPKFVELDRGRS